MNELLIFGSAFGVVFALGLQSLNVNAGHYRAAFFTSLMIGMFNLFLLKLVPQVTGPWEIACYLFGGPVGVVCAMLMHGRIKAWITREKAPYVAEEILTWPPLEEPVSPGTGWQLHPLGQPVSLATPGTCLAPGGCRCVDYSPDRRAGPPCMFFKQDASVGRYGAGRYGSR